MHKEASLRSMKEARSASSFRPSPEQMAAFRAAAEERVWRKKIKILIVEDQAFSRKLLMSALEYSYTTYTAENANTALDLYCAHAPDIALLNVELPGASGHELAATIHTLDALAYIVMVTAANHRDDVIRAQQNGAKGYIVKPYSKQKLQWAIDRYIGSHNGKVGGK
jgi:two-component system chemotaxis response regulator CheY